MRKLIIIALAVVLLSCTKNKLIDQPLEVTTTYTNGNLYGTVNKTDSLIRGFVIGVWNGKEVVVDKTSTYSEYGVGNFGMKPIFNPTVTYYVWAFVLPRSQGGEAITGNIIVVNN